MRKDYIRLNIKNIKDLPTMLVDKAEEFFDIQIKDLSIRLVFREDVSCYHNAPIGEKTNWGGWNASIPSSYPGWHGAIYCRCFNDKFLCSDRPPSISEFLFPKYSDVGFTGFNTGTGCPGSVIDKYPMNIEFYFFLQDFPLLQKDYNTWKSLVTFSNEKQNWKNSILKSGLYLERDHI